MAHKLQLGALDTETKQYVTPTEALKGTAYTCVECNNKVILKKGTIRKPHFAHHAQTNVCGYYDHPNESQIHKDAKLLMAKLLKEKKCIQFCWECDYQYCKTRSDNYAFQEVSNIVYKDGDEVHLEYRDKDNKWIADVAIVNNGEVRYIIEIKNTHATTTARPEPWFEVGATELIEQINELNSEHPLEPERDIYKLKDDYLYAIPCMRKDIVRYCYGSFCWKESWVNKMPGYDKRLIVNECILCKTTDFCPCSDGCTDKFQNGEIRVCIDCLMEDTYKKKLRKLYAPSCYGHCFIQNNYGGYSQNKCPEKCKLIACSKCKSSYRYPYYLLATRNGLCLDCDVEHRCMIFIRVPYANKDEAKALGAQWNPIRKAWYIYSDAKNKATVLSRFKELK